MLQFYFGHKFTTDPREQEYRKKDEIEAAQDYTREIQEDNDRIVRERIARYVQNDQD